MELLGLPGRRLCRRPGGWHRPSGLDGHAWGTLSSDARLALPGGVGHPRLLPGLGEGGARYALAWIDAQPEGLVVGSIHLRDACSADSTVLEEQLKDFGEALPRMRSLGGDRIEVAISGDWNVRRPDLEVEGSERAAVLADFARRHGLKVHALGRSTWRRPTDEAGGKELD